MEEKDKRIVLLGHPGHINAMYMTHHLLTFDQEIVVFDKKEAIDVLDFKNYCQIPDNLLNPLTSFKLKMPRKMKKRLKKLMNVKSIK